MANEKEDKREPGDSGVTLKPGMAAALRAVNALASEPVIVAAAPGMSKEASGSIFKRAYDTKGSVVVLRRGDTDAERLDNRAFLQQELVDNKYLDGKLMVHQYGHMRGTLTLSSVAQVRSDFKALGLDIKVGDPHAEKDSAQEVVIDHKDWAMLRTLTEFGGRDAIKKALDKASDGDNALKEAIKFRYEQVKDEYAPKKTRETAAVLPTEVNAKDASKREPELV